ncbi:MAG: response regulator [Arenimonas sp.]
MARILIVEDNQANMKLARLLLGSAGHSVLCAVDAETGLTLARTEQPDLILMDIQLPGMDGLAATALLKNDPATASIPVIALTAMAMKADEEKTRAAGCDGYIAKPLRYQQLYAAIDALLEPPARGNNPDPAVSARPRTSASQARPADTTEQRSTEKPPEGRPLILVAEDNETNQKVILRQLALLGFSADVARDGRAALELWQTGEYALLLTDLQMPDMDGYELVEAIRAREQKQGAQRMPIVVMTASTSRRYAERFRTPDMDDYLSKPLQLSELKAALDSWLPAQASLSVLPNSGIDNSVRGLAVDVSVLERLVGSDLAVVRGLLHDFRSSASNIARELKSACVEHEPLAASAQAHKLAASAFSVGALALGELCKEIEKAGRAGNTQALAVLLPLFERELEAVDAALDSLQARR